jgi:SPP1 gp7 family putative phage head morphogenesis protein
LQIGISLSFEQTNPLVQDYLKTQALEHAQGINTTTRNQMRLTLSEGIRANESLPELSKRVSEVFAEAKGYRSTLIARQETTQAYAHANHEALRVAGVVKRRKWLTAGDDRVRPAHAALNGVVVDFNQPFPTGIEPGQEFQCRCQEIGIVEEAA